MPYDPAQIGEIIIRPINLKTRNRLALILVDHGREPGIDERHVTVLSPAGYRTGRRRVLHMVASGIDLQDIRVVEIPENYLGSGEGAGEGIRLWPVQRALWWTANDDCRATNLDMTERQYAAHLLENHP